MRTSPLPALAVAALLVLSGCAGLAGPDDGDGGPSADEYPDASAIDGSVFDDTAAVMANASFTFRVETEGEIRQSGDTYTSHNSSERYFVEPGDPQYLVRTHALESTVVTYSNGSRTYVRTDNESAVLHDRFPTFNESSESYLWRAWFRSWQAQLAVNATYDRVGAETVQGVPVMRYEAAGVDGTLPERIPSPYQDGNTSSVVEEFSATLLLDADGVIRHFRYEYEYTPDYPPARRTTVAVTLSDVGSTDVVRPDWVANATAAS